MEIISIFWLFGMSVNLIIISKLLIRPVLWSTTNSFLGCILTLNFFYLLVQIFINIEEYEEIGLEEDPIIQSLELLFTDSYKSIICSARYMAYFIHGSSTLYVMVGIIFIRSIMIKHADNIRQDNLACKSHQARLSVIGILVAVLVFTGCFGVIIGFILLPRSPFDFVLVRNCRGVSMSYSEEETHKIISSWLTRLIIIILISLAIFSCQVRIIVFKRRHNSSYFSHFRQNIATLHQTFAAAYLKICMALVKEVIFFNWVTNSSTSIEIGPFLKLSIVLDCIFIPCFWMYSTKHDFREFWCSETVFWRKNIIEKYVFPAVPTPSLEPRRPHILETSFIDNQSDRKIKRLHPGRFSFSLKMH
jgi:hypothetical protein